MLSVGIGGTVYTMKSACASPIAAAEARMKVVKCMFATAIKGATTMYKKAKEGVKVPRNIVTKHEQ
jgi:hypothetical protein